MVLECEYCGKNFVCKSSLVRHQRNAKYCLKIQNQPTVLECEYCGKVVSRKDSLARHYKICKERGSDEDITETSQDSNTNELIVSLLQKLVDNQPTTGTTNINRNMNLAPLTDEDIKAQLESLTLDFIFDGARGYANYAYFYPLYGKIICTDKSRKKLRYRNGDGEMVEDGGGLKLAQLFFQAIAPRNEELINAEYSNLQQHVVDIAQGNTTQNDDLVEILTKSTKLQDLLISCRQTAKGESNDLSEGFIRHLSKHL